MCLRWYAARDCVDDYKAGNGCVDEEDEVEDGSLVQRFDEVENRVEVDEFPDVVSFDHDVIVGVW